MMNAAPTDVRTITIGRGKTNHIIIPTLSVTDLHAQVMRKGSDYWLEDNNSSNGTFVNNFRVTKVRLNPADQIRVGNQLVTYRRVVKAFTRNPDDYTREFAELETVWNEYVSMKTALENRSALDQSADLLVSLPLVGLALGRLVGAERNARKRRSLGELEGRMTQLYACPKCGTPFPLTRDSSFQMLLQRSINQKQGRCLAGCGAIWTV